MTSNADRLVTLRTLAMGFRLAEDVLRQEADTEMAPGDRRMGMLPNGERGGRVTKSDPELVATVTDPDALGEWLAQHYPDHVKPAPKGWAVEEVLAASKRHGQPVGPGGELDVPGVSVGLSNPVLKVYANREVARVIAVQAQEIIAGLALPRGDE